MDGADREVAQANIGSEQRREGAKEQQTGFNREAVKPLETRLESETIRQQEMLSARQINASSHPLAFVFDRPESSVCAFE